MIQDGLTPLIYASENEQIECMKYLIDAGANVSQGDNVWEIVTTIKKLFVLFVIQNGMTPLLYASHHGNLDSIKYLISAGVEVSQRGQVSVFEFGM